MKAKLQYWISAHCLMMLYICTEFGDNISKDFRVIRRTQFSKAHNSIKMIRVGGKKGNRTEPNRTTGLYRTEPTEISDSCGTGFYRRHRTEPTNAIYLEPI